MKVKKAPDHAEATALEDLADADGVLRVRVQPGPAMRWFQQGFFMGLGFITATAIVWLVMILVIASIVAGGD